MYSGWEKATNIGFLENGLKDYLVVKHGTRLRRKTTLRREVEVIAVSSLM